MPDESHSAESITRVTESQQHTRSQELGGTKSLLGGASQQNPFANQINVVADTPSVSSPTAPQSPSDAPAAPAAPAATPATPPTDSGE